MPRRSGGGGSRTMSSGRSAPAPAAPRQTAPAPVPRQAAPTQPAPMPAAAPRQPGLFANMASTAAGVAVGSAVGHTLSSAIMGGGGGNSGQVEAAQQPAPAAYPQQQQQPQQEVCSFEMEQFLQCSRTQPDISLCQGFNEAWKQCRARYGYQ